DLRGWRWRLSHGAGPGEEPGQSWDILVSTAQSLPMVAKTEQRFMAVGDVDVVAIWEDLLPEGCSRLG
ncbi:unnamed protein product, partial [Lampetra planeri]